MLFPKPQIYGFALGGTSRILYRLKNINCCYLIFPNNIYHYLNILLHDQPSYILGMGSYSGIDQDKIRLETVCSNQFRNDCVEGNTHAEMRINPFLKPTPQMKLAAGIGNSYCNLVSWKIMQLINGSQLRSRYTFLHIPKTMKSWVSSQEIDRMLHEFKYIK